MVRFCRDVVSLSIQQSCASMSPSFLEFISPIRGDVRLQTPCRNPKGCVQLAATFWLSLTTHLKELACWAPLPYVFSCLFIWVLSFLLKEKRRRRRGPTTPPPLLLQDPEKVRRRIEERVAMLLAQEVEFPPTPQLPTSRILEVESGKAAWLLPLPKNKDCFLWNFSALTGPCDPESFYAAGLTPPIEPWKPVQVGTPLSLLWYVCVLGPSPCNFFLLHHLIFKCDPLPLHTQFSFTVVPWLYS